MTDAKNEADSGASISDAWLGDWVACADRLPDIPEGELSSPDVLAGCWITDDWLRDDHPQRRRFIFGACRVLRTTNLREFTQGKQWHTFGPSHNQITHWRTVEPPNVRVEGLDAAGGQSRAEGANSNEMLEGGGKAQ